MGFVAGELRRSATQPDPSGLAVSRRMAMAPGMRCVPYLLTISSSTLPIFQMIRRQRIQPGDEQPSAIHAASDYSAWGFTGSQFPAGLKGYHTCEGKIPEPREPPLHPHPPALLMRFPAGGFANALIPGDSGSPTSILPFVSRNPGP